MDLKQLLTDPNYTEANIATKNAIFEKFAAQDPNYKNANDSTKEAIRDRFGIGQAAIDMEFQNAGTQSVLSTKPQERNLGGVMLQSLKKAGTGIGDIVVGWPQDVANIYKYATTENAPLPTKSTPVTNYARREGFLTPENEPNTPVLKAIDFTTQLAATGGVNPMNVGRSLLTKPMGAAALDISKQFGRTGAAGVVGSGTQQFMESTGASPLQQMIGTGVTMAGTGAATGGVRTTPADVVNRGLRGVTPEQIRLAELLQQESYRLGMPITGPEAIAQVSGNKSLVGTQRFLENAGPSQGTMSQFMANRPEGVQRGFNVTVEGISPNAPTSATPINLKKAANQVIEGAETSLTGNVNPYFKEAGKQAVPNTDIAGMLTNPRIADAVEYVRSTGKYGVKNEPANSVKTLVAAKQYLDDEFSKQMNAVTGAEKNAARVTWSANRQLDDYLNSVSPDYAKGSRKFEVAQKTQIGPLKEGPVGLIAEGADAAQTLMPPKPVALYPADIKRTAELLRRKEPTALPDWTRQNLEGIFNETTQKLVGGENQFGGPKFASTIAGNKQQRENLRTLVTEASGMQAWQGFEKFLDVAEAQGQRMPANSATAFNQMAKEELGGGLLTKALTPFKPSNLVNWAENVQLGRNSDMLAKMLTDPDSVKKLEELARTGPKSAKTQALVNSLAGAYTAQKPEIKEEEPK